MLFHIEWRFNGKFFIMCLKVTIFPNNFANFIKGSATRHFKGITFFDPMPVFVRLKISQ